MGPQRQGRVFQQPELRFEKFAVAATVAMAIALFGMVARDHLSQAGKLSRIHEPAPPVRTASAPSPLLIHASMFKPATVSHVPGSSSKLSALFEQIGYRMDRVLARGEVPRLFMSTLPHDLPDVRKAEQRKLLFIKAALPLILHVNELILHDRARLAALNERSRQGLAPSAADEAWLGELAGKYGLEKPDFDGLLARVDIVPPSLALAQSAEESGWGTSRFAREGNALFGQRTWSDVAGLIPHERAEGETYRVRTFGHLIDGVKSYARNLNSHPAYEAFRRRRAELRAEGATIDGEDLAGTLHTYSERGAEYIKTLRTIMRVNRLSVFDLVRLGEHVVLPPIGPDA